MSVLKFTQRDALPDRWLSIRHAAEFLDCSVREIYRRMESGEIPWTRMPGGGPRRVRLSALEALMADRERRG